MWDPVINILRLHEWTKIPLEKDWEQLIQSDLSPHPPKTHIQWVQMVDMGEGVTSCIITWIHREALLAPVSGTLSVCLLHQHQDCALYYTVHDWMFKSTGCSMVSSVHLPSDSYCQLESMTHENNFCNSPPARWPVVLGDEDSRLRWWCHPYPALVWGLSCEPDDDFWGILLSVYFSFLFKSSHQCKWFFFSLELRLLHPFSLFLLSVRSIQLLVCGSWPAGSKLNPQKWFRYKHLMLFLEILI